MTQLTLILTLLCLYVTNISGRTSEKEALIETQKHVETLALQDKFSGVILIAKNNKPIYSHAIGYANRDKKIFNSIHTLFNIASMGKMFTGVAICQLAQQKKLLFTDTISKHIQTYPNAYAQNVSIHDLLTHKGRLGDIFVPQFLNHQNQYKNPQSYIDILATNPQLDVARGTIVYSNYGYIILGAIIEAVSGMSFDSYIHKNIVKTSGMKNLKIYIDTKQNDSYALGYHNNEGSIEPIHNTGNGSPAGGNFATAQDILYFAQALCSNQLVNEKYTKLITTEKVSLNKQSAYGYGFMIGSDQDGAKWFGHSGGCIGMNTELRIYPESGYTIIALGNSDRWNDAIIADFIGNLLPYPTK